MFLLKLAFMHGKTGGGQGFNVAAGEKERLLACRQVPFLWGGRTKAGAHLNPLPLGLGFLGCHLFSFWC